MKKIIGLILAVSISFTGVYAQKGLEKMLGSLGVSKATPNASYAFEHSFTYKVVMLDKRGKETSFTSKMYFSKGNKAFGIKMLDSNDPDMSKAMSAMDLMVMDLAQDKMFNFMSNDGKKIVMGISVKPDKLQEDMESKEVSIKKTGETKTIMGYECDGYLVNMEGQKEDVMMWVSQKSVDLIADLGEDIGKAFAGSNKGKRNNYYGYNTHPEFVKLAKQGRVTLGYSSTGTKGEKVDFEFTEVSPNENYVFSASDYDSLY